MGKMFGIEEQKNAGRKGDLDFITAATKAERFMEDVRIAYHKERNLFKFSIKKKRMVDITKNGRIAFAVLGNRLYFQENSSGYKITFPDKTSKVGYAKSAYDKLVAYAKKYEGIYEIEYDPYYNFYYIEGKEK